MAHWLWSLLSRPNDSGSRQVGTTYHVVGHVLHLVLSLLPHGFSFEPVILVMPMGMTFLFPNVVRDLSHFVIVLHCACLLPSGNRGFSQIPG
jgi:hypothetical protein